MYIAQAYKGLYEGWRYLVGFIAVLFAWQLIAVLPLAGALVLKTIESGNMPTNMNEMPGILGLNLFLFLMLLTFAIGLGALFLVVRFIHRQTITGLTTSRPKIDWDRVKFSFLLWAIVSVAFIALDIYFYPDDYVWNFQWGPFLVLVVIAVIMIPLQTSFEEYFMRGYMMQGLGVLAKNRWVPLAVTSLIFGLLHIFNPEVEKIGYGIMVYYIGTGFFLGILTLMDEGLELALGFHAANNLTAALLVTADWTAFQTHSIYKDISEPELGWDIFIPVLVIYPILLFFFGKKYGWTNWKERLAGKVSPPVKIIETTDDALDLP